MRFSTRGRYALRAMIELAMRAGSEPVMVRDIASAQDISEDYLEQVLIGLRKAGLVRSIRGANGGYFLARPPEEMSALVIVEAVEGPLLPVECLGNLAVCNRSGACAARELWSAVAEAMRHVLKKTTLAVLRDRQQEKTVTPVFQI